MSYTIEDLIRDILANEQSDDEKIRQLEYQIRDRIFADITDAIYSVAEEWNTNHGGDSADDVEYVRGVYRGLLLAATEVRGF